MRTRSITTYSQWIEMAIVPCGFGVLLSVREDGSRIKLNETIDASVFERWRADPTYRPANLVEWTQLKKVDPAQLQTSVRANDPRVVVPDQ